MMAEIYQAFKGQPSSAPLGSVILTLALTHIPANVKGENATNTTSEEPPSHTKGETGDATMAIPISSIQPTHDQPITSVISHSESSQATPRINKGKGIATESDEDPLKRLIQEYWDKEEKMKKAAEEAKLIAMSRPEVIKVVREEAKKLGINPKEAISTKAGETFKKAQDAEHEVLKREHSKKKIPEELRIQSALPAPVPEQASSQTLGRKKKHIELEPEVKVPGMECNRSLPK
ncbi:hypothetical protein Tco_0227598 [Tanacetum coccineum]